MHIADGYGPHLALIRPQRLTCLQRNDPIVQRTRHRSAMHDALAQRAALVRAMVFNGEDLIFRRAEYSDLAHWRFHTPRAAQGNIGDIANIDPVAVHRSHSAA